MPVESAQITWATGKPAVKLAFTPGGAGTGVRRLQPPSPAAPATFIAVWGDEPSSFRRCQPGPETTGELRFDAGDARPGAIVTGTVKGDKLACTDGSRMSLSGEFRAVIIDVR